MTQTITKTYIKTYFKNIKDKDLETFFSHGLYCEKISKILFENLIKLSVFNDDEKKLYKKYEKLLYISSDVHDLGNLISGDKPHNKKGAKFVIKNKINELTDEENLIVANIIRFHRGKSPKDKNKLFGALNNDLKAVVRFFSGILRIADALDFGHFEIIENVSLKEDAENKIIIIYLDYDLNNNVGFNLVFKKKRKLLGKVLDRKIVLRF